MKTFWAIGVVGALLAVSTGAALASRPIRKTFDGCVIDGMLVSSDGYRYRLMADKTNAPFVPATYEGRHIKLSGLLYPGDWFRPDGPKATVIGKCHLMKNKRLRSTLAWAYRGLALQHLGSGEAGKALRYINRAIALDAKMYAFYRVRASVHDKLGNRTAAHADGKRCLKWAKDATERKWCRDTIKQLR